MRVLQGIILAFVLMGLVWGLSACQKADPATQTLGGVVGGES